MTAFPKPETINHMTLIQALPFDEKFQMPEPEISLIESSRPKSTITDIQYVHHFPCDFDVIRIKI